MEEIVNFFSEANEQEIENFIYFSNKLLEADPEFFSQLQYILEHKNYEQMIQKMKEFENQNPQLIQMEENRIRQLYPNDKKFQEGFDLMKKLNEINPINKHNNSNVQSNGNNLILNSKKIKQMLKGENVGNLRAFREDMIDPGIKKDINKNKQIAQKVNNQNNIKQVNMTQIFAPFQQLDFNMFNRRGQQINNTSLSKAQNVVNEDDKLGRGIFDDFRPIKYRATTMPKATYINPPIIPKIQGNRLIYNIKDFL